MSIEKFNRTRLEDNLSETLLTIDEFRGPTA